MFERIRLWRNRRRWDRLVRNLPIWYRKVLREMDYTQIADELNKGSVKAKRCELIQSLNGKFYYCDQCNSTMDPREVRALMKKEDDFKCYHCNAKVTSVLRPIQPLDMTSVLRPIQPLDKRKKKYIQIWRAG